MLTEQDSQIAIAALAQRLSRSRGPSLKKVQTLIQESAPSTGMVPVALAATVLASSGLGSTEDSFISVNAGAPTGAKRAEIRFSVNSTDNADDGDLRCMGVEGIDSGILVECVAGTDDARDTVIKWVNLDANGNFQVKFTNTSTTSIDWSVTSLGYSMG